MLVSDLFRKLSLGELSNLAIGMDGSGTILEAKKPKLVSYLNEALLRLYSRFILREEDVIILQDASIRYYELSSRYALTYATPDPEDILYIQDTAEHPFLDDAIKVLEVRDTFGAKIGLNDPEDPTSVFTPQPTRIQVPSPETGEVLGVLYQARHPVIDEGDDDAVIDLPATLEQALRSHIAYQTYSHMNGQENSAKAAEHLGLYEAICAEIEGKDLANSTYSFTNTRFERGGWV